MAKKSAVLPMMMIFNSFFDVLHFQILRVQGRRLACPPSSRLATMRIDQQNWWKESAVYLTAKLLLALASTVILGSESHGTHDLILLSDGSGSLQTTDLLFIFQLKLV
jgi:uncharacterized membrane protein YkvI